MSLQLRVSEVFRRIEGACKRSGRTTQDVKVVAISKKRSVEEINRVFNLTIENFGENYVQEGVEKVSNYAAHFSPPWPVWHFVGTLQTNKIKKAVSCFSCFHGVDRLSVLQALNQEAQKQNKRLEVLLQVKLAGPHEKLGFEPDLLEEVLSVSKSMESLTLKGLMTFPPRDDKNNNREIFKELKRLKEKWVHVFPNLTELSMGVSSDYEVAIEEGATLVRLGEVIFGPRV